MARIVDEGQMNLIGKQMRRLRKQKKMSQKRLSEGLELLGVYVCRGSVSRIEDGLRTVTDVELLAIARVLEVEMTDLFSPEDLPDKKN